MTKDFTGLPLPFVRTVDALRQHVEGWKTQGERVALVPTMGALHDGHLSLVHEAKKHAQRVVVSIFVNPTQFAPHEDFSRYPRTEQADAEKLAGAHVDLLFAPTADEMYGGDFSTSIHPSGPAQGLESDFRPHFFAGVATVVTKLFNQCMPDAALFGEKDYQQLQVIRHVVRDLDMPVSVIGVPTMREADGLAMSSRNIYLSPPERMIAARLNVILAEAGESIWAGTDAKHACERAAEDLISAGFASVDYVSARDADTLKDFQRERPGRVLAAAWLGKTRLIDNLPIAGD